MRRNRHHRFIPSVIWTLCLLANRDSGAAAEDYGELKMSTVVDEQRVLLAFEKGLATIFRQRIGRSNWMEWSYFDPKTKQTNSAGTWVEEFVTNTATYTVVLSNRADDSIRLLWRKDITYLDVRDAALTFRHLELDRDRLLIVCGTCCYPILATVADLPEQSDRSKGVIRETSVTERHHSDIHGPGSLITARLKMEISRWLLRECCATDVHPT